MEAYLALDFLLPAKYLLDVSCELGHSHVPSRGRFCGTAFHSWHGNGAASAHRGDACVKFHVHRRCRARADVRVHDGELVLADVARVPLSDDAFDAVHTSAALNCCPRLQDGLHDIRLILASGSRCIETIFLNTAHWSHNEADQTLTAIGERLQETGVGSESYSFLKQQELVYLLRTEGFQSVEIEVVGWRCAIVRAVKRES